MTRKVYIVTDLGFGDAGKGGVVHAVAKAQRAHTVVKRGGAQGSHGVVTSKGEAFSFSQWGCGTFDGIPTHLSDQMIVSPEGWLNESEALRYERGIDDPFALLTVDARALVTTPLHGIASRLFELARGGLPRGTVGTGVGQAYRDARRYPQLALTAGDLKSPGLLAKLHAIRDTIQGYVEPVLDSADLLASDAQNVHEELNLLKDNRFLRHIEQRFSQAARLVTIVDADYLATTILPQPGVAVVETTHGVLTDNERGFHPHTSAIRTLPCITRGILDEAGYEGEVVNLGVTRAYAVRHGAGPLPTQDQALLEHLAPGSQILDNRWQGSVRVGALDGVLLRYALNVCGGAEAFDGLAVTWFDQIRANGNWALCNTYQDSQVSPFFTSQGDLHVPSEYSWEYQESLATVLGSVTPVVKRLSVPYDLSDDASYSMCATNVQDMTGVPVRMVSMGPTEQHKLLK